MTATNRYIINTGHVVFTCAVLATIATWPRLQQIQVVNAQRAATTAPQRALTESAQDQVRLIESRHDLAMARAESGACVEVVDSETGEPLFFSESLQVVSRANGQVISPGQLVCNSFGESGEVGPDGAIIGIAVVRPKDRERFVELIKR
jgi:hypothetical protein